ncbi:MAG: LysR family transcriptional regulator [Myxococcales bacterium]|nr:LysR family transcriptional regulator [Myxococcales bacterium]
MQRSSNPLDLPWDDVRLFLALCRARRLGDAARTLGIDTSTVSRRLSALEDAVGARLFDRGREGVAPTALGEKLRPAAEEVEERVAQFARVVDGFERDVEGTVTMTCPPDIAEVLIVPLLHELFARHPKLRLDLQPSEAVLDLTRREADLAIRVVRPTSGDLLVTKLGEVTWRAAGSEALVAELGALRQWEDTPWIGWGERFAMATCARWLAERAPSVEPRLRSDSMVTQLAACRAGLGAALLPEPSLPHFGLVPLRLGRRLRTAASPWPVDEVFLVTHRALREVPRVRVVREALVAGLGSLLASPR